jgi:membrane fusion protein, multidrug efflux system
MSRDRRGTIHHRPHGTEMTRIHGAAAALAALALGLAGCASDEAGAAPSEAAPEAGRVISVEVEEARPAPFTDFVRIVGTVAASRDVTVAAEEGGVVRQLFVEKGTAVRAGQPIARVDDGVLRAQLDQAAATARLAAETWERQQRLWEVERVGSEMAYLQARYNALTAEAGARVLRERVARTVVRAPIDGVLDDRFVEVGSMVAPGAPVARIVDASTVKVLGGVPERYAADVNRGAEMQVGFEGLGVEHAGRVAFVGATLNESNRTFPIEVRVPNPGRVIRPGMAANLAVARGTGGDALLVPRSAVLRRENGFVVYVAVERDGHAVAESRDVTTGGSQGGRVVIEQGLEAGERVIVVGQQQVASGDRLRIVQAEEAARP